VAVKNSARPTKKEKHAQSAKALKNSRKTAFKTLSELCVTVLYLRLEKY